MFITLLFTVAPSRSRPSGPSIGEWLDKQGECIHAMSHCFAIKKNKLLSYATTLDELQRHYIEKKMPDTQRAHTAGFCLYQILEKTNLTYGDRKQIGGRLGLSMEKTGWEGALQEHF